MDPAFRQDCIGSFSQGLVTIVVGLDNEGQLTLTVGSQPTSKLLPYQARTFTMAGLEGFRVEFRRGPGEAVDELIFHQPNGTFAARRV